MSSRYLNSLFSAFSSFAGKTISYHLLILFIGTAFVWFSGVMVGLAIISVFLFVVVLCVSFREIIIKNVETIIKRKVIK